MKYRFITPNTEGKWYPSLELAQKQASKIGAGYFDNASEAFYKYANSQLQVRR